MQLIEPAPHEFAAQFNYDRGLDPYFALDQVIKSGDGSEESTFSFEGQRYEVTAYYQDSNIIHPGETTPTGTPFRLDEIREFRLSIEAVEGDDQAGQKSFGAHVRPRWERMSVENKYGDERQLNVPFTEGINIQIQGSNIAFQDYRPLLCRAMRALNVSPDYVKRPHGSSVVTQAEMYLRVHEDVSGPVHARDGPLARMGHLLEDDRAGRRRTEQADVAEDGEKVPGYRHQAGVDEDRIQEIFPDHSLPKQVKHYRTRESHNLSSDDPLRHPKVGAIYYPKLWRDRGENHGVAPAELAQLREELEEMVLSILHDAGIDVTSSQPYIADDYFSAETTDRDRQVVNLPLEDIRATQESVVMKHVSDGLSPVEWEALETLVTDGGEVSPQDIADSGGFHEDSVYRALDGIDEMLEREYGSVSLRSSYVGELVHDTVQQARQRTREAVEAGAKALEAAERGLDERTSALVAWASKHTENFRESDDGISVRFGEIEADSVNDAEREIRRKIREGKQLWDDARKSDIPWRLGDWSARVEVEKHPDANYLNETRMQSIGGRLWDITGD